MPCNVLWAKFTSVNAPTAVRWRKPTSLVTREHPLIRVVILLNTVFHAPLLALMVLQGVIKILAFSQKASLGTSFVWYSRHFNNWCSQERLESKFLWQRQVSLWYCAQHFPFCVNGALCMRCLFKAHKNNIALLNMMAFDYVSYCYPFRRSLHSLKSSNKLHRVVYFVS